MAIAIERFYNILTRFADTTRSRWNTKIIRNDTMRYDTVTKSNYMVTNDIDRSIGCIKSLSMQCFYRNWMHEKLWINDTDCLVQIGMKTGIAVSFSKKVRISLSE